MPKLYTPVNPASFTARIRDPATIVTNVVAPTDDKQQEGTQTGGATNPVFGDGKEITQQQRETEPVTIRSFVKGRCPTMQKGTLGVHAHNLHGEEREVHKGHHGPVHCVEYSPDGEMFASGSGEFVCFKFNETSL